MNLGIFDKHSNQQDLKEVNKSSSPSTSKHTDSQKTIFSRQMIQYESTKPIEYTPKPNKTKIRKNKASRIKSKKFKTNKTLLRPLTLKTQTHTNFFSLVERRKIRLKSRYNVGRNYQAEKKEKSGKNIVMKNLNYISKPMPIKKIGQNIITAVE